MQPRDTSFFQISSLSPYSMSGHGVVVPGIEFLSKHLFPLFEKLRHLVRNVQPVRMHSGQNRTQNIPACPYAPKLLFLPFAKARPPSAHRQGATPRHRAAPHPNAQDSCPHSNGQGQILQKCASSEAQEKLKTAAHSNTQGFEFFAATKQMVIFCKICTEAFRHRCVAWSSKPMCGITLAGRFDSCTLPPIGKHSPLLRAVFISRLDFPAASRTSVGQDNKSERGLHAACQCTGRGEEPLSASARP